MFIGVLWLAFSLKLQRFSETSLTEPERVNYCYGHSTQRGWAARWQAWIILYLEKNVVSVLSTMSACVRKQYAIYIIISPAIERAPILSLSP
jgi:hypothetical protein